MLLAGCGGGSGGGSGGGGGNGNVAPVFTSAANVSYKEDTARDFRTAVRLAATDANGDSVEFGILPGKDAALFSFFGENGNLGFNDPVSYETPVDADKNNVYEVDVSVTDGKATTKQTVRITVTNDTEGVVLTEFVSGLPQNANITYLDDDRILMVDEAGNIAFIDSVTGAITRNAVTMNFGGGKIVDIFGTTLQYNDNKFLALAINGTRVRYLSVDATTSASTVLWEYTSPTPVTGSIGQYGVALSDGGDRAAAQDKNDPRGNVTSVTTGYLAGGGTVLLTNTVGWGLHDPVFGATEYTYDWTLDRGENFNEVNQGGWELSQGLANFEWPKFDGFTELAFSGVLDGYIVKPRVVQQIGANGAGRWTTASDGFQTDIWRGKWVMPDDQGNIYSWDALESGPIEKRNLDFGITDPTPAKAFIDIAKSEWSPTRTERIFLLRADGKLFVFTANR